MTKKEKKTILKTNNIINFCVGEITLSAEDTIDWKTIGNVASDFSLSFEVSKFDNSGKMTAMLCGLDDIKLLESFVIALNKKFSIDVVCKLIEL